MINYYEALVLAAIQKHARAHLPEGRIDEAMLEDAACIALNQLPPRYIRHHVDTSFYLSTSDREAMETAVEKSVQHAFERLREKTGRDG